MWAKKKALHGHHDKEMIKDPPEHFNRRTLVVTKGVVRESHNFNVD
jgi:hypothetical protein